MNKILLEKENDVKEFLVKRKRRGFFSKTELKYLASTNSHNDKIKCSLLEKMFHEGLILSFAELMNLKKMGYPALARRVAKNIFKVSEILELGDFVFYDDPAFLNFNQHLSHQAVQAHHFFTFSEIQQLQNPVDYYTGLSLFQLSVLCGQQFTVSEIESMGNPRYPQEQCFEESTIAQKAAQLGQVFSVAEILLFKNPVDRFGVTPGHWLARRGHKFTCPEILQLGNPVIHYSPELLEVPLLIDEYARFQLLDEQICYQNKTYLLHNGATIAHIMAREGHVFTDVEIEQLGNPKDAAGLTIQDWQSTYKLDSVK